MSLNVIDLIKGQLGPALVTQAASQYGESESGISKAIGGLLPAVVGGLANNSNNQGVLNAITTASSSGILGNLMGDSSNNTWISGLLTSLFGDKVSGVVNAIATYAGISNNSSSSLLNLVTGATVGTIGKYAADNNLDQSGISKLLDDQKGIVSSLLPAGLSLASLNVGDWAARYKFDNDNDQIKTPSQEEPAIEVTRSTTPTGTFPDRNTNEGGGSIWKWLLPLLLLIAAAYFLWKQCDKNKATTVSSTTDSTDVIRDTAAAVSPTDTASMSTSATSGKVDENIDLNGTTLKGYKGGMEDQMINFMKSGAYTNAANDDALKNQWFDFDHVNFKLGSANALEAGSEGQLQNLVAILKAYPDAKIKIGGYTDKTGDEAKNVKLSADRANYIKNWLDKQGVGGQVLGAEGYGSQFAKVDATASDAERASDRKMSVRFAK
ncbi:MULTISPECIES: OmpA family protein [Chryseobacterium]|uniref:Outer membrane protein OmpA-like peptidoglycan-associated protein n=1 Tax=Chryseobacterium geocarposphaerae TaxID=1416776 RepID=A0ABU1LA00_9FLAO|nr:MULTISPECIES: OmpA family protein [Chryseobacterium]MDR6403540.1 outer membrane protein OmpA-like peptidoglycan-associated protein [Chryseobacterium geocarposphaerae]MDR6697094.1 outer membrane protein OmpA-like peptidoglycan-associated protein [Chryseobacterium ginsenosidimutans]